MIPENSKNSTPAATFQDAMLAAGIEYNGQIIGDGTLHRVKVNGDSDPNGWYVLHLDGIAAGSFGCWKRGIRETWCAKSDTELTPEERAERDRRWKQQQAERKAEDRRRADAAAAKAQEILSAAQPATDDHPYLQRKGVKAYPGVMVGSWPQRKIDNCLLLPLRRIDGSLSTVEAIFPSEIKIRGGERDKDFLTGGAKTAAFFAVGNMAASDTILICEGYATGATLHKATGYAVAVAFDAGNLRSVAEAVKAAYPYPKQIVICGDSDRHTDGNPGRKAALAASKKAKVRVCLPAFADDDEGSDFNDLAALHGMDRVFFEVESALTGPWRPGKEATSEQQEPATARAAPPRANKGDKLPPQNVMAHMLATEVFQSRLRVDPITSRWLEYQPDAGTFKPRPAGSVERAVYLAISDLYVAFPASYVSSVTKLLAYEATTEIEPAHGKIPFQNGVLDLKTRELLPHSPDFGFTAAMPYPWDPHAPAPQVVIDWLLEAVGGHADQVQLLRAFLHAVVVGRPDLQRYLELVGPGGSGKGTFMRLAAALVGICSVHSTQLSQLENNRFETAALFGKRLVLVTDAEKWRGDVSVLKSITGQDPIRYEQKHVQAGESFTFNGMVILAGNQHLESTDYSSGIQRRRITVDFSHVVQPGQRRDLEAEFAPHLAGVMQWVLDMPEHEVTAYLRSTSVHVGSLKQTRIDTLMQTNPIAGWCMDAVEFGPGFTAQVGTRKEIRITSGDGGGKAESWTEYDRQGEWLYPNYCRWCDERGKRPIACNAFAAQLIDVAKNMLGQDVAKMPRSAGGVRMSGLRVKRAYDGFDPEPNSAAPVSYSVEPVSNYVEPVSYQPIESVELFKLYPNYKDKHSDATANTEEKTQDHASHGVDVENRANVGGKSDKSAEVRQVQHYQGLDTTLIQHTSTLVRHQCSTTAPATPTPPKRPENPPVCLPAPNYPFRYLTKCDRPTPIMREGGYGDPLGCSHCGAMWATEEVGP